LGAGFIAGVLLTIASGREYTVCGKDGYIDLAFTKRPQLQIRAGPGYDEGPSDITDIATAPESHIDGEYGDTAEGLIQDFPYGK
jgi:hypothetical protein